MKSATLQTPMLSALVVEDSTTQGLAIRQRVQRCGFSVRLAANAMDALSQIEEVLPTVVLTDLEMPEMSGLELIQAINRRYPGLPVLLLTAKGSEEVAVQALRAGAAGYVPKDKLEHDLARVLESILAITRASKGQHFLGLCHTETGARYLLPNDETLIPPLVARLQENLERQHLFSQSEQLRIGMALREALVNAIEHGNLEMSSELRDTDDDAYRQQLDQRRRQESYRQRRVTVVSRESRHGATYTIIDEGPGFDPACVPDPTDPANLERSCGRGLLLIQSFMDKVSFNARGNEITMAKYAPG